jgi:hypothetical protein
LRPDHISPPTLFRTFLQLGGERTIQHISQF